MTAPVKPPRVANIEEYWLDSPPALSPRCIWWVQAIDRGWRRNRRIGAMGYYGSARWFGVWIWEWLHVLYPRLRDTELADIGKRSPPTLRSVE